jgi:hypothetical protein
MTFNLKSQSGILSSRKKVEKQIKVLTSMFKQFSFKGKLKKMLPKIWIIFLQKERNIFFVFHCHIMKKGHFLNPNHKSFLSFMQTRIIIDKLVYDFRDLSKEQIK